MPPSTVTEPSLPVAPKSSKELSDRPAVTKFSMERPGIASASIANVQSRIVPSGMPARSPESATLTRPGCGSAKFTDLPAPMPMLFVQLSKVRTFGSKSKTKGATVTVNSPLLASAMGTLTWLPGAPAALPIEMCGPSGTARVRPACMSASGERNRKRGRNAPVFHRAARFIRDRRSRQRDGSETRNICCSIRTDIAKSLASDLVQPAVVIRN